MSVTSKQKAEYFINQADDLGIKDPSKVKDYAMNSINNIIDFINNHNANSGKTAISTEYWVRVKEQVILY